MATTEFWQRVSASVSSTAEWSGGTKSNTVKGLRGTAKLWMALDGLMVLAIALFAMFYTMRTAQMPGTAGSWSSSLIHMRPTGVLPVLFFGYTVALLAISRRFNLYAPMRLSNFLHEQRLSVQTCLISGLLLTSALYLVKAQEISRNAVLMTICLVTVALSMRRLIYRALLYRRFDKGVGTRNVLIVGTGPEAHALRHHLESIRHLGFTFKGFIDFPSSGSRLTSTSGDVVGSLDTLFDHARKQFIDEIFFTSPCERGVVQEVLEQARTHGVDLRVIPDMYDGLTWNSPVEYVGQFPTIPLHRGHVPEFALMLKRAFDVVFSLVALVLASPLLLIIAIAIKLDSKGPVFYRSERIGKKGHVFLCTKFRTMVSDAEQRRAEFMHMNERDGVLFKITNDPRITKLGCFLRKYSLDELPQFFNVLRGDMSVVGPRPPIASEVREYKLSHMRRLDVTPGVTGLWQVQGRQDPSFDSYVSLDVTYIENWTIWLDIKIILRTILVVFAGTGS